MTPEQRLLQQLRDALADADVDVGPLLEEAFAAAREEVSQTLQRMISQDLLRRTLESMGHQPSSTAATGTVPPPTPTPTPAPDPEPTPAPDPGPVPDPEPRPAPDPEPAPASDQVPEDTTRPTYVYGVTGRVDVASADLVQLPGGGPARVVRTESAQAVVCDVDPATFEVLRQPGPEGLDLLAAAAHAHDANLASLAAQTTVLPLPLGTVLADDATVVALLDAYGDRLRDELDRFEGRAEWAVRVHLLDDPSGGDDAARAAASGSEYLRRRGVALEEKQSRWRIREELATRMHDRLAGCADQADVVVSRPLEKDVEPPLLHGVYLLDQAAVSELERVVAELRDEHDAAVIEMTGPWPPYHFASVDLSSPEPRS